MTLLLYYFIIYYIIYIILLIDFEFVMVTLKKMSPQNDFSDTSFVLHSLPR